MKTQDASGACEACHRSKEKCQFDYDQPSCSRCSRLGKACHPRTKRRFGRPPVVKKFDHGSSGLFSLSSKRSSSDLNVQPDKILITQLPSKSQTAFGPGPTSNLTRVHSPFHQQVHHILTTEDGFFLLHRHWLIAKSLSSDYQHTVRRLFSHSPFILADGYASVLELFNTQEVESRGLKTTVDFTRGAKCLEQLVQSSGSLRSIEDAAIVLMLGQILFVYNVLISWPCTHIIIRNTLITTSEWYPTMLKYTEWDPATLTPVLVDTIQCLVRREVPVLRLPIEDRVVVDRLMGVSSSLLPLFYDLCIFSHRVKIHAPAPVTPALPIYIEAEDDAYSTVERQISSWEPVLPPGFFTKYTRAETSALLAQARMYKTAGLMLIHRLRHPLGVDDETGKRYAEELLHDLSSFTRSIGRHDASGIGSNFLLLLITLELPEQGYSLIRTLEPFRLRPKQSILIREFVEYVMRQRDCGFDRPWCDLVEEGLFGVALP